MENELEVDIDQVDDIRVMTTEVVTAYLSSNQLPARDLSGLIVEVFNTLSGLGTAREAEEEDVSGAEGASATELEPEVETVEVELPRPEPVVLVDGERPVPAIPIEDSVTDSLIFCLECGKGFKTLKRHLSSSHGLTPEGYRKKWDLLSDYPLVAPNYSASRSATAKQIGLGRRAGSG